MIKIYPFMKKLPIGFIHELDGHNKFITYMGRPLLDSETFLYPMYDLKSGKIKYMKATVNEFKRVHEETNPIVFYSHKIMNIWQKSQKKTTRLQEIKL